MARAMMFQVAAKLETAFGVAAYLRAAIGDRLDKNMHSLR